MFIRAVFLWTVNNHTVRHETESMTELQSDSTGWNTNLHHPTRSLRTTQWFNRVKCRSTSPCWKFKNYTVIQQAETQIYITLPEVQEPHSDSTGWNTDPHHPAGSSRTTKWFNRVKHRSTSPCRKFKNYTVIQQGEIQIYITLPEVPKLWLIFK